MFKDLKPADFIINTERLTLRPLVEADFEVIFRLFDENRKIQRFFGAADTARRKKLTTFYQAVIADWPSKNLLWIIELDGKIIGSISLEHIDWEDNWIKRRGEIGFWLITEKEGNGYMTEAVKALQRWAFEKAGFHKLLVNYISQNKDSAGVVERTNFRLVGKNKAHFYRFGKWWDYTQYELLAEEWQNTEANTVFTHNEILKWGQKKVILNQKHKTPFFHEREIWLAHLGKNIITEAAGKGEDFFRPVLVLKKLSHKSFVGIPLTKAQKEGSWFFGFNFEKDILSNAQLSQIKNFDAARLHTLKGRISPSDFKALKEKLKALLNL